MALIIPTNTTRTVSLDDYVDHVSTKVNLADEESVVASAPMLRSLANDRNLIVAKLNNEIEQDFQGKFLRSAQAIVLKRAEHFYVRAGIWPSTSNVARGRIYQEQFSYDLPHDHNFMLMTTSYLGPGYETDVFEYDYEKVKGFIGEDVALRALGRTRFGPGTTMLYRASRDVHIQYPPSELTISINLVWAPHEIRVREQFVFDVGHKKIAGYVQGGDADNRVSFLNFAALLGNANTRQLLDDLAIKHPCRRTRLGAFEALARLAPEDLERIWGRAAEDPAPLVNETARARLKKLTA